MLMLRALQGVGAAHAGLTTPLEHQLVVSAGAARHEVVPQTDAALSQARRNGTAVRWGAAAHHSADIVRRLVETGWPANVVVNVNFPDVAPADVTGVEIARQGRRKIGVKLNQGTDPRGNPYVWVGTERDEDLPRCPG